MCFSISYRSSCEELNAGDEKPRLGGGEGGLEVLCEPPIAVQPGQRAFDPPSARQDVEPSCTVGAFDNPQGLATDSLQGCFEPGSGIGPVGEDMTQPREGVANGREHGGSAVAVLDVDGVDLSGNRQVAAVGGLSCLSLHVTIYAFMNRAAKMDTIAFP